MSPADHESQNDVSTILEAIARAGRPVIALDMDDVLVATHQAAADWHNETYKTNMDLSSFYYYHWWKNPYWGTPAELIQKQKELYKTGRPYRAPPVEGAPEGVRALHALGFCLVVVTTREKHEMDESRQWLREHFDDLIDEVVTAKNPGNNVDNAGRQLSTDLSKVEVCRKMGAIAIVDDALENALACASASPPVTVLLFGNTEWAKRNSVVRGERDPEAHFDVRHGDSGGLDVTQMSYAERLAYEGERAYWEDDASGEESQLPQDAPVVRVSNWNEVVAWASRHASSVSGAHAQ